MGYHVEREKETFEILDTTGRPFAIWHRMPPEGISYVQWLSTFADLFLSIRKNSEIKNWEAGRFTFYALNNFPKLENVTENQEMDYHQIRAKA